MIGRLCGSRAGGSPGRGPVPGADDGGPRVLELRIHGVNNTPPHAMLEVAEGDAERVRGDTLGSFWAPSASALAHARSVPATHHDHVGADVRREAYSWGPMARASARVPFLGTVAGYLSQAGWLFLLPLGFANVAYWSRRLRGPGRYGRGASSIRIFALGLSLFVVTSFAVVGMGIVASQCFRDAASVPADGPVAAITCAALPSWLHWLGGYSWASRLVIASLVPVVALVFLQWLSRATSVRYEGPTSAPVAGSRDVGVKPEDQATPVLGRAGLWSRSELARSMAWAHLAGGLALLAAVLSWNHVYVAGATIRPACLAARTYVTTSACLTTAIAEQPWFGGLLVTSFGVLAWAVVVTARARADAMPAAGSARRSVAVFVVAAVLFAATVASVWIRNAPQPDGPSLAGLGAAPGVLLLILLGIALAGLGWRRGKVSLAWYLLALAVVVVLGIGGAGVAWHVGTFERPAVPLAALGLLTLLFLSLRPAPDGTGRTESGPARPWREQAWSGAAPGVFLLLSLGAQMLLASLAVVAVGDWLNGEADAGALQGGGTVTIPGPYVDFSVAMPAAIGLLLGFLLVLVARMWFLGRRALPPAPLGEPADELRTAAERDSTTQHPAGTLAELTARDGLRAEIVRRRRVAALAHRAEVVAGFLAGGFAVAVGSTVLLGAAGDLPVGAVRAGLVAMAALWASVVLRVITAGSSAGGRPIALIWDLMCFLPRSAHPFGPPCYADRAVPEIAARMDAWLRGDDLPTPAADRTPQERAAVGGRRVVLSAHSQGAVLAVAALFTEDTVATARNDDRAGRVALLTYGTQLRTYFGRMFPEVLGPAVLGTPGVERAVIGRPDPWARDLEPRPGAGPDPISAAGPDQTSVVGVLRGTDPSRPAWVNVWRRTDYLGFPVASYRPNVIDRGAEELDTTAYVATVATHGGYPRAGAYRRAMREVLGRLG